MSAIAGLWRLDGRPDAAAGCARMLASQEIYGPHDGKYWSEGSIAMGRRLFRTLPEDAYDRQPLHSVDGRLVLVADVRLDNREELSSALGLAVSDARQLCDAAILLRCLTRWGADALDRLVGDFAFALWDSSERKLLLARDILGQRPLHYHRGKGFFAFASMPRGLHALPEIPYAPDEQAMAEFVTLMPQVGPRSFFTDVARVEAGHVATITRDGITSRRYWNPLRPEATRVLAGGADDYVEGLRHHLDLATRSMLRGAGGTVATHLSAGYDSASVTATAARLLAPTRGTVVAFTAVPRRDYRGPSPSDQIGDEGPLAAATAAMHPNIEHVLIRTGHLSPLEELDRYFALFDRPILNLCNAVWTCAINAAARERKLTILLTGQMGNLTLSYSGVELLPELLRAGRIIRLMREAAKLVGRGNMSWRGVLANSLGPYLPAWLWQRVSRAKSSTWDVRKYTAIRGDRLVSLDLPRLAKERGSDFFCRPRKRAFESRLWALSRVDLGNYNKGILAGWGIDQRDPTADKRLVEYCLRVPTEQFLANGETRALARRALSDRLPQVVLNERAKGYQVVDWHEGLSAARGEVEAELSRLLPCAPAARTLDIERLQNLVSNWPDEGWERQDVASSYRLALLRGISAGHFLRKASGTNA